MKSKSIAIFGLLAIVFCLIAPSRQDPEVICSSADPNSCYPRLFQATDEFQAVQAGQAIPAGLHVRLNIQTGEKEAKIYNRNEDDGGTDAVIFDKSAEGEGGSQQKQIIIAEEPEVLPPPPEAKEPPSYSNVGKIMPPKDGGASSAEYKLAADAVLNLPVDSADLLGYLKDLEDLAHDIYFGVEIASSQDLSSKLFDILHDSPLEETQAMAATVLGSALRNNPSALKSFLANRPGAIDALLFQITTRSTPMVSTKIIYLISSLMAGQDQANMFRVFNGHVDLKNVFEASKANSGDGKDNLRARIARLIGDWVDEEGDVWCEPLKTARDKFDGGAVQESIDEALTALKEQHKCEK